MMKFEIDYSQMPDYVRVTTSGRAAIADFAALLQELTDSPHWVKGAKKLIDHRNLDLSHFGPGDIQQLQNIVSRFASQLGNGKCAWVMEGIAGVLTGQFFASSENLPHSATNSFSEIKPALFWLLID